MSKAVRVLLCVGVLLAVDAVVPRPAGWPPPLVSHVPPWRMLVPFAAPGASGQAMAGNTAEAPEDDAPGSSLAALQAAEAAPAIVPPGTLAATATSLATVPPSVTAPGASPGTASPESGAFVASASAGWDDFRGHLFELDAGRRRKVRVVQLGDSEIASDWVARTLRRQFARRYGDGGPGFALAMAPWPWYWREGFEHDGPDGFTVHSFVFGRRDDGNYGPGGIAFDSTKSGATATVRLDPPPKGSCEVSFHYGTAPDGGEFDVVVDGVTLEHISTRAPDRGPAVRRFDLKSCPTELTAFVSTDASVRLFGWNVETDKPGIVWSTVGVISATSAHFQHYTAPHLVQALADLRPDLIVLGYGLNLLNTGQPPPSSERISLRNLFKELREGLKDARCLALSPYPIAISQDGTLAPSPGVAVLARYQRDAAAEGGCAFLDREKLAGGPATALKWLDAKPRILSGDYLHLTATGSEHVGRQVARVLLNEKPETM